jgi:hypothetical protein
MESAPHDTIPVSRGPGEKEQQRVRILNHWICQVPSPRRFLSFLSTAYLLEIVM